MFRRRRPAHRARPRDGLQAERSMTYVVTEACIRCKYMDCVEVCPVDCFYEGDNMLVIHPDECIDCGVCEPECPVDAILPDTETAAERWLELNRDYSQRLAQHHPQAPAARGCRSSSRARRASSRSTSRPSPAVLSLRRPASAATLRHSRRARRHGRNSPVRDAGQSPHFVLIITQHDRGLFRARSWCPSQRLVSVPLLSSGVRWAVACRKLELTCATAGHGSRMAARVPPPPLRRETQPW